MVSNKLAASKIYKDSLGHEGASCQMCRGRNSVNDTQTI